MHPTRNDLPEDLRIAVVKLLNDRLADAIDLQLQSKQTHWNVRGPHFLSLHELFDQVAEKAREFADEIAERATALGGTAEGTLAAVVERTKLPALSPAVSDGRDCADALSKALAAFGKQVRAAIAAADAAGDLGTADLFTQISREADKQLWMVESHLECPPMKPGSTAGATAGA